MRAEVIAIGDELTTGQRLDTNSQWLSERLIELGIDVAFHTTVGDNLADNVAAFRAAIDRVDVVVATGGLGPTADDLTREAMAAVALVDLVQDDVSLEHIRQLFARRARAMPDRNARQALFPRGSRPISNPHGTAPGIDMSEVRADGTTCRLFALPGVPVEMFAMWSASVAPAILAVQPVPRVTRHCRIRCYGAGESHIEAMLPDLIRRGREPRVGITVSDATITLRITATAADEAACLATMEPTVAEIKQALGALVFGVEEDELQHAVVKMLKERHQTVSVAEWATDGLVSHWLADAASTSDTFRSGVVVHDIAELRSLLYLTEYSADEEHILSASETTAVAMAQAIRLKTGADYGLAVAAWPITASEQAASAAIELKGTLNIAIATSENVGVRAVSIAGHPALRRPRAAKDALNQLRHTLINST